MKGRKDCKFKLYAYNDQLFRTKNDGIPRPERLGLDAVIDRATILIEIESDLLLKWGSFNKLNMIATRYEPFVNLKGMPQITLLTLDNLTAEEQAYVINGMLRYTATGFVRKFAKRGMDVSFGRTWLHSEMERLPID